MKKLFLSMISAVALISAPAYADTEAVDQLNELLRGELSAVETYKQALEKVKHPEIEDALQNHEQAVQALRDHVKTAGGEPADSSGVWGTWAKAVTGTAKAIGDETALKALKEGEEHGIKEYEEALENEDVPVVARNLIKDKLLPNQRTHIDNLNKLMAKS